ncbi:hypothetical protein CRU99_12525 [Malaciobacter mytili]|uniref:hypothetical protein n=1 Tax=Malaciobacter mytili TaxID=603050 RepID=UPI00100AFC94|nr:hypothetical protein [Malaciobacter mytili]RXI37069.1 hypothetical protein CRU99_12525 [Malaciobacter mytili]
MNILISLLYAPFVFFSLRYFDIKIVCINIFIISLLWFFITIKKDYKQALYPLVYIFIAVITYFIESFYILKVLPLLIAIFFTALILISYINKTSIILFFAKKFSKKNIDKKEEEYIYKSTLFWFFVALVNCLIHFYIFISENISFWLYYSSFGWYFIFIFAGILQFLHKKFIFNKSLKDA